MNHAVIFGRRTFEEIGKPLPGRINIVVSSTKNFQDNNLYTVKSLTEALKMAGSLSPAPDAPQVFICGGQQLYESAINFADKIYLTKINATLEGDTFFPEIKNDISMFYENPILFEEYLSLLEDVIDGGNFGYYSKKIKKIKYS